MQFFHLKDRGGAQSHLGSMKQKLSHLVWKIEGEEKEVEAISSRTTSKYLLTPHH